MAEYYVAARRNDIYEYAPVAGPFPTLELAQEAEDALSQLSMDHDVNRQFSMNTRYSASKTSVKRACGKLFSPPPYVLALRLRAIKDGLYQAQPGIIWAALKDEIQYWPWKVVEALEANHPEQFLVEGHVVLPRTAFLLPERAF